MTKIHFLFLVGILMCGQIASAQKQQTAKVTSTNTVAVQSFPINCTKEVKNFRIYDFELLPLGMPCIAMNDGLFVVGLDEWLLPANTLPVRSVTYNWKDSSLMLLSQMKDKAFISRFHIGTGNLETIDSIEGKFSRLYDYSSSTLLLVGKENGEYGIWTYNKSAGYTSNIYRNHLPITAVTSCNKNELLVATGAVVIRFDAQLQVKEVIPIGYDIDGLMEAPGNTILVSTRNGIIRMGTGNSKDGSLVLNKYHGPVKLSGNSIYVLDADNKRILKLPL